MILHFLTDDKFADYAIDQFSAFAASSEFIVVAPKGEFKFIKNEDKVKRIDWNSIEKDSLLEKLSEYTGIILHGLFMPWQEEIIKCATNQKIAWMFWGGEIYGRPDVNKTFIASKSRILLWLYTLKNNLKGKREINPYFIPKECYSKINYCLTDVNYEYDYANRLLETQMDMIWYNYYSIEDTVGTLIDKRCTGNDIFLGNSCTIENNHLETFSLIKKLNIQGRRIITPLSYGSQWLRNFLIKKGNAYFKDNFHPLVDFMPREAYNSLMLKCGVMVMNHYRPQAQGNIITGLWLGMRVFLSRKSMIYNYFKDQGIIIYSIEEDLNKYTELKSLNEEELQHNRSILYNIYSKESMLHATKNVIDHLT